MSIKLRISKVLSTMLDDLILRIPDLLSAILLLIVFYMLAILVRKVMRSGFGRSKADRDVANMMVRIVFVTIVVVGIFEALTQMKVNLAALGIGVGLVGFGVGFATKDILGNFLSGVLILMTRPFVTGDSIRVKEFEGTIEAIEMRGTVLHTADGKKVIIPNTDIYTNAVTNNTAYPAKRVSLILTLAKAADVNNAIGTIFSQINSVEGVLKDPAADVLVKEISETGVKLEIRYWCSPKLSDSNIVSSNLLISTLAALSENNIDLVSSVHQLNSIAAGPVIPVTVETLQHQLREAKSDT